MLALAGLCAIALIVLLDGGNPEPAADAGSSAESAAAPGGDGADPLTRLREAFPVLRRERAPAAPRVPGPSYKIATVRSGEEVELRDAPDGEVIAELGDRTEFGSVRNFGVARTEGEWLAVRTSELPNGELGWIRDDPEAIEHYETSYSIHADLSERLVRLRYGKKVLDGFRVTVGGAGSPTPPGDYAVTDALAGKNVGRYYGCCILALTGHQPNLPPDWLGGDRIAIHGTPGPTGLAASLGCLRASNADMVGLFARVPLGAPVFIRP